MILVEDILVEIPIVQVELGQYLLHLVSDQSLHRVGLLVELAEELRVVLEQGLAGSGPGQPLVDSLDTCLETESK